MPLLDDIISGAVDDQATVQKLLRQCLVLAHQLKNEKLKAWADQELKGYNDPDALPEYRLIKVTATGSFSGPGGNVLNDQPLSASVLDEDLRHWATTAYLTQPIAAYDIGKDKEGRPHGGSMPWPGDLVAMFQFKFINGWSLIRARQDIPGPVFASIIDTVRTRILQLALELKDEMGDKADVSDIPKSKVDQSVVNHIYGGNVVVASNAQNFSQVQNITVNENDLPGLISALKELGLIESDVQGLKEAIEQDAEGGIKTMGKRTAEWLKDLPAKLGNGTLKVGFDAAKALATKYVLSYFGLG